MSRSGGSFGGFVRGSVTERIARSARPHLAPKPAPKPAPSPRVSAATIEAVLRRLASEYIPRVCPACGKRPDVMVSPNPFAAEWRIWAHCHGATEFFSVGESNFRRYALTDDWSSWADRIRDWLRGLFKADASPDMMELYRRNAESKP